MWVSMKLLRRVHLWMRHELSSGGIRNGMRTLDHHLPSCSGASESTVESLNKLRTTWSTGCILPYPRLRVGSVHGPPDL